MAEMRRVAGYSRNAKTSVVKGHQKDLAKVAGKTAGKAAFRKTMKATERTVSGLGGKSYKMGSLDKASIAYSKAKKKATKSTLKSFKKSK